MVCNVHRRSRVRMVYIAYEWCWGRIVQDTNSLWYKRSKLRMVQDTNGLGYKQSIWGMLVVTESAVGLSPAASSPQSSTDAYPIQPQSISSQLWSTPAFSLKADCMTKQGPHTCSAQVTCLVRVHSVIVQVVNQQTARPHDGQTAEVTQYLSPRKSFDILALYKSDYYYYYYYYASRTWMPWNTYNTEFCRKFARNNAIKWREARVRQHH